MRDTLAIFAGLIALSSTLPYIRDTIKGKTRPNVVTWFTWTSLNAITSGAAFAAHATQTGIFAGSTAICTGLVVITGLRHGLKKYTTFDYICQALAIIGIILWRLSGAPALAILLNIISDLIGVLPTYRHAWKLPHEETWQSFAIGAISSVLAVASVQYFNFVSLGYPVYILLSDISLVGVILYRLQVQRARRMEKPVIQSRII